MSLASYSFGKDLARCWQGAGKDLARSRGLYDLAKSKGARCQVPCNRAAYSRICLSVCRTSAWSHLMEY